MPRIVGRQAIPPYTTQRLKNARIWLRYWRCLVAREGCTGEESSSPTFVGGISLENNQQYIYCESESTLGEIPDGEYTLRF
jgi:hypothetical protein